MSLAIKNIDNFLTEQVNSGACNTTIEAEHELVKKLMDRDIKRGIEQGRVDIKNGDYEEVNQTNNKKLINEITQELITSK